MERVWSIGSLWHVIRLSRTPNLIIIGLTQYIAAIFLANPTTEMHVILMDFKLFLLVLSTVIIAAAGYYINDYYDIKIDMINKPDKVIVGSKLERRPVLIFHSILNFVGIAIGAYVSIWVGVVNLFAAFLLWLYSNQLKRMPALGNLAVSLLTSLSVLLVALYFKTGVFLIFIYGFFAFATTLIREIIKDIEDMKGDAAFGSKTIPIILGIRRTKWILYFLIMGFTSCLFYFASQTGNKIFTGYFIILSIPSTFLIYKLIMADTKKHFYMLSQYCKWLIVGGIISMTLINQ